MIEIVMSERVIQEEESDFANNKTSPNLKSECCNSPVKVKLKKLISLKSS